MSSFRLPSFRAVRPPTGFVLPLLFALFAFLAYSGAPQARAQNDHTHNWTAGDAPRVSYDVFHLDGRGVDSTSPTRPCEVVEIVWNSGTLDSDLCTAAGCPFTGGWGLDHNIPELPDRRGDRTPLPQRQDTESRPVGRVHEGDKLTEEVGSSVRRYLLPDSVHAGTAMLCQWA